MTFKGDCRRPVTHYRRLAAEAYCLLLVFIPHHYNNTTRKLVTVIIVSAWALLEVVNAAPGLVPGDVMLPEGFAYIRIFIGVLVGRMWGIQFNSIADYSINSEDDDGGE